MKVGKGFTQPIVVDDPEEEASSNCGGSWKYQRYDGIYIYRFRGEDAILVTKRLSTTVGAD